MQVIGIIPARYNSTRFPGKPLIDIKGKSMIQRVYEQCKKSAQLNDVIIATDDNRIIQHTEKFKGKTILTSKHHASGTDRCNEVIKNLNINYDLIVNIQGDEPYISPDQIDQIIDVLTNSNSGIATLAKKITEKNILLDINTPKILFDENTNTAIDFLRSIKKPDPKKSYYKHIGVYGFRTDILKEICSLTPGKREVKEKLEQLRWLENGYKIGVGVTNHESISIDTPEDLNKI